MQDKQRIQNIAVFCDFENLALGVRDAQYKTLDMRRVLERLLLKGSIVVKKAYCDWDRYKEFKGAMHEVAFELIEIPHVRQSGKNSADIRMVVDALDLCYTKTVIGVGVKSSTSDLLIANCDEFIYYDDLVLEAEKQRSKKKKRSSSAKQGRKTPAQAEDDRKQQALDLVLETIADLFAERGEEEKVWGSMVKQALKRRQPGFSESSHGFRSFSALLEEAEARKLLTLKADEKSGGYIIRRLLQED